MITILVVLGLTILISISFLAGTSYADHNRDQSYRRLAAERRALDVMLQQALARSEADL